MSSSSKEAENDQPDISKYEEACAGLTPVLEAVDELPASGSPITPAVQNRVRQFFIKQISTANPTAASSGSVSTGSKSLRPRDLQDTKQLHEFLQKHVKEKWVKLGCKGITPLVSASIQLVADAAHQVARQQLVEKNSQAYSILLDDGYRAGVMVQACAALRAAIGLRIITQAQLARVLVIVRKAGALAVFAGFNSFSASEGMKLDHAATRSYAWDHLKPYYVGSSSSAPAWTLSDSDLWDVITMVVRVTNSCLPNADDDDEPMSGSGLSGFEIEMDMRDPEVSSQLAAMLKELSAAQKEGRSAAGYMVLPVSKHRPSRSSSGGGSGNKPAAAAGSKAAASKDGSSGSGSGNKAPAAAGSKAATSRCGSSGGGSGDTATAAARSKAAASGGSCTTAAANGGGDGSSSSTAAAGAGLFDYSAFWKPVDKSLPLDDCPLLAARCRGLGPVLEAVAGLQTGSRASVPIAPVVLPLSAGIKHYTLQQLAATDGGSGGSGSGQPGQGGPRRRTVVPMYQPGGAFTLSGIADKLGMLMQIMFAEMPGQLDLLTGTVPSIVQGVVKQVAKEQVVEKNCVAFNELVEAAVFAGLAAVACTWLYTNLGISLRTEEQFCSALVHTCDACTAAKHKDPGADVKRSIAFNLYQTLKRLTAPAAGDSSSDGDSSGGGGGSGSGRLGFAMPECGLDAAYTYLETFPASLAFLTECEGVMTKAQALAAAPWEAVSNVASGPMGPELVRQILPGLAGSLAAAGSTQSAGGDQAADWGKSKGLAGLKGLFSGKQPDTQPATKPVTVRANGSGVVVTNSTISKATAVSATGKGTAQAAAGANGPQQTSAAGLSSSSSKAGGSSGGKASSSGDRNVISSNSSRGSSSSGSKANSSSGSKASKTPPELLVEANLKQWYCSPDTFGRSVVEPLPEDSLELLVKLKLHTKYRDHGWNALHYACASHRHVLVKQLLDAGASASEPEGILDMQPLHLACLGRLDTADDFYELTQCTTLSSLTTFVEQGSYADGRVVALLLDHGANPSAWIGKQCPELSGITPLHILSLWTADGEPGKDTIFANPFAGRACWICKNKQTPALPIRLAYACSDLAKASEGVQGLRWSEYIDELELVVDHTGDFTAVCEKRLDWNDELQCAFLHVATAQVLLWFGAKVDARGGLHLETPLMFAAGEGNAAMTALLLAAGADPELTRLDGSRALEIAADQGYPRVGWALLCYGAQALPAWYVSGKPPPLALTPANLSHEMLVCHAVQCDDSPWNLLFLERLLADGALIEGVWAETGETPLLMAISYKDPEMVRMLVMAGANVNAHVTIGHKDSAIAHLLYKSTPDEGGEACKEILQILIDAGADLHSWQSEATEYDYVQTAANMTHVDAALKLVESGCKWQLPKAQHVIGGSVYYAPEILCCQIPTLFNKRPYVESRFKRAEKMGRQKRAAIASALQPWLSPNVTSECKGATLKCLTAAGVTPCQPQSRLRSPVPSPRGKAPWAASAAAAARKQEGRAGAVSQQQQQQQGQAGSNEDLDWDDIDAMLAEIESVGSKGGTGGTSSAAGASGGSKAASKKKKKETAAQKEAKKKQQLRAQLLQQQQQQRSGSSSDSDDGEGSSSSKDAKAGLMDAAAGLAAAANADRQDSGERESESDDDDGQLVAVAARVSPAAATVQQQQQQHAQVQKQEEIQQKQPKGKKGKAAQQQQAQAQASSGHPVAGAAAGEGTSQRPGSQPRPAMPPAAAAPQTPPQAMQAALNAAMSQRASAGAGAAAANTTAVQQTPADMPGAVAAAHVPAAGATGAGRPVATAVRPAFLPPHLRMSMPGSAPSSSAAAAAPPAAATAVPQAHAMPVQVQMRQNLPEQQVQDSQQGAGLRQRMVELAQQHQLQQMQQQALRQGTAVPQQQQHQHMPQPQPQELSQQQQQQQQQQQHTGEGCPSPALPHAMMALLSSSAQQHKQQHGPAAAAAHTGHKGHAAGHSSAAGAAASAGQKPAGAKRQPPGVAAPAASRAGPATLQQQQQQQKQQHDHAQPQQRATPAGAAAAAGASRGAGGVPLAAAPSAAPADGVAKGPKLCIVCSERRRNVLLIPCNHLVLCDVCAVQLHGQGQLGSCPHCQQPCKQRIRVHKS